MMPLPVKLCHLHSVLILSHERPEEDLILPVYISGPGSRATCWKSAKPMSDGARTRTHSSSIPKSFYFFLGQLGLNGVPDPEAWARAKGGMFQQTSLFGRNQDSVPRFPFKLCFWALPAEGASVAPPTCTQPGSLWAFSAALLLEGKREIRGAVKHSNWFLSLAGFFHLQSPDVYLCLQFSGKIKITQGRTSKSPRLPELEETSEILIVRIRIVSQGLVSHWMISTGRSARCFATT